MAKSDGLTYNGEPVTSVAFAHRGRGNLDTYRADLVLRNGDELVADLRDLKIEALQDAVGLQNAMRINRSAYVGEIPQGFIRAHVGRGPVAAPERNVVEPGAAAAVGLSAAAHPLPPGQATEQHAPAPPGAKVPDGAELARRQAIRDALAEQFDEKDGTYRFRGGDRSVAVRETRSGKIVSPSNDPLAAQAAVQLADAAGHGTIVVRGHADFKREAWIEATARGMEVAGYKAREADHEAARRRAAEHVIGEPNVVDPRGIDRSARGPSAAGDRSRAISGTLIEHGAAPYKHDPNEKDSYYVRIRDARGERTLWGKDLERAIHDADLAEGDRIVLKKTGRTPVTVSQVERDELGKAIGERQVQSHLNRWEARHEGASAGVQTPTEGEPEVARGPAERHTGRQALKRAATIYAAAKTTTVAAAVRLAEHLRPGIEARAPTRSAVHPQHKSHEPEQEIPTP